MNEVIESKPHAVAARIDSTPAYLLQIAVETGKPLEYIGQLMSLQERWEANEARKTFNAAFSAFKSEAVQILKDQTVKDGPLKGKKYASLYNVVEAATPALSRHGLSASWKLTKDEKDWIEVTCTIKHVGGHSESVSMGGPPDSGGAKNAIHARASTVTYLERYTLKAITGLSETDDDNDGGRGKLDPDAEPLAQPTNLALPPQRYAIIRKAAGAILQAFNEDNEVGAYGEWCAIEDHDERLALWSILRPHPACRRALSRMGEEEQAAQAKLERERAK
jgi:hypothetical protein